MIIYYQRNSLIITDGYVSLDNQRYAIDQIKHVWTQPPFRHAALLRRVCLFFGGGAGVVGGAYGLWLFLDGGWRRAGLGSAREFLVAYLAFVAFAVGIIVLGRFLDPAPGRADLWIRYGTLSVRLASRLDAVEMGKARRALHRARERRVSGYLHYGNG